MADLRRLHTEILCEVFKDRARQQRANGGPDINQDEDDLTLYKGPVDLTLAGATAATQIDLPIGATAVKFIAVYDVDGSAGVNVRLGAVDADPITVKPGASSGMTGYFILTTDVASVYVDNPSDTAQVSATMLIGCS